MALDSARLVARSLSRSWRRRPARMVSAVAAGIGGVLLTTAMLVIAVSVLDAIRGASIAAIRSDVVAVEARTPGGMAPDVVQRIEDEAGTPSSRALVVNTTVSATPGGEMTPSIVYGVDERLGAFIEEDLGGQIQDQPLTAPDEVYLTRTWADEHGAQAGDTIRVSAPSGVREWRVAALLDGEVANNGAVVIAPIQAVASAFERGSHTDVLLLDTAQRDPGAVRGAAREAADGAAGVMSPGELFSGYNRQFTTALTILATFAVIAVLTSAVVLFLAWRLALNDARPMLARMRLFGVRTRDLMLGSAVVMVPVLLVSYVIGAALGLAVGTRMSSFTRQITELTQQAVVPGTSWQTPALGALAAAVLMFGAAWLSGLRRFTRITPIEAVTGRDQTAAPRPRGAAVPLVVGAAAVLVGVATVLAAPDGMRMAALLPLLGGGALLSIVLPVAAGGAMRRGAPRALRLLAGRQLQIGWRRNAALGVTFAVATMMALTMAGVASSIKDSVADSVERWTEGELYVQAAPAGKNLQSDAFSDSFEEELRSVKGVAAACPFSYTNVGLGERRVQMWSWGGPGAARDCERLTGLRVEEGTPDFLTAMGEDEIAISSNFARTRDMSVGDSMELPLPTGHREVTVAAVVDDSASDGGMLIVGSALYHEVAANPGPYAYYVGVAPGTDPAGVQQEIEGLFGEQYPRAVVVTQEELRDVFASITARLVSAFEVFAWVMFVLAVLVGAATLASGLVERQRALALTRLAGARSRSVLGQILVESLTIAAVAWVVAMPVGVLLINPMLDAQALQSGLLPSVTVPTALVVLSLPLVAACVLLALLVANPRQASTPLRELLAQE
jgi:putative ABC transport system permease protein